MARSKRSHARLDDKACIKDALGGLHKHRLPTLSATYLHGSIGLDPSGSHRWCVHQLPHAGFEPAASWMWHVSRMTCPKGHIAFCSAFAV